MLAGEVALVTSRPLLAELGRVLVDKFGWDPPYAAEAIAQLVRCGDVVEAVEEVQVIDADPADDRVLEAALAGHVSHIISGDRHLRDLRTWCGISILASAQFLAERS